MSYPVTSIRSQRQLMSSPDSRHRYLTWSIRMVAPNRIFSSWYPSCWLSFSLSHTFSPFHKLRKIFWGFYTLTREKLAWLSLLWNIFYITQGCDPASRWTNSTTNINSFRVERKKSLTNTTGLANYHHRTTESNSFPYISSQLDR